MQAGLIFFEDLSEYRIAIQSIAAMNLVVTWFYEIDIFWYGHKTMYDCT